MFLTQAVAHDGFPFEIKRTVHNPYISMTEDEMLQRLEQARKSSKNGNYRNADAVISDLRGKHNNVDETLASNLPKRKHKS